MSNMSDDEINRMIDFHLDRAADIEEYANHWWRASKYGWLYAAAVHRHVAASLNRMTRCR